MIYSEQVKPRVGECGEAWEVRYATPKGKGLQRFGGFKARAKATNFAVEKLQELLDNPAR